MKYLILGGELDGQRKDLDYDTRPVVSFMIRTEPMLPFTRGQELSLDKVPYGIARYRKLNLDVGPVLIPADVTEHGPTWALKALYDGYKEHTHCDTIMRETGRDCYRTDK